MDAHRLLQVLEGIRLGGEVAEHENDLSEFFVSETHVYARLLRDEVDVIAGCKGSGKSALYRIIAEADFLEDVHVLKASNPTLAPTFRALFQGDDSEERLRAIWVVYVVSLIGNYVVDKFSDLVGPPYVTDEIRETLETLGLRALLTESGSLLSRIRRAKSVEGGVQGGAMGLQAGVVLRFDLPDPEGGPSGSVVELSAPDFFTILEKCGQVCEELDVRVWLAFDRLDECFAHDTPVERRALRALLRTVLDVSEAMGHRPSIRLKVFLRSDMLSRMTRDGAFTNATHLRRVEIRWTSRAMRRLVSKRLIKNRRFVDTFLRDVEFPKWEAAAWQILLCSEGQDERQQLAIVETLFQDTADGSREFNPRNVISLLTRSLEQARAALRRELETRGDHEAHVRPLVRPGDLEAALEEVSRLRFEDTVLNEFPAVRELAERLRGGPTTFGSDDELLERVAMTSAEDSAECIEHLLMSGLVGHADGRYTIPRLYWHALDLEMKIEE
jgi:hypothetical protein